MKEYKLVILNEEVHLSRKKDIADAEKVLNQYVSEGWELQQIVVASDLGGEMIAVLYKDKDAYMFN
ncbi:MAG: DUF4177 domain-containing protein [Agathobacter sp.]|nr:DUF4177 domain-containing protein [Agathobacter sp.]